ncbi:hypothetical protein C1Y08_20510 [Pseudomonas sp. FW306-02-F02-AA]|uniref:Uncharacterized protein n=1 Tax=Pseudomonas fluorescens TaxID=294 RepID=A0A0N9WHZ7_PSEFL|nr:MULTISPECIES: hypothetical protein [Pseudomonas]ALI04374.1 hypothetical protein AO353_26150 [Pseudomonas fluorescens]PMZ03852.1 hypothetical protein C1Y07_11605 [Pseudomonas sp. FW306-02-F02-AB]PMZ08217.1 hypothetical protein C1Y06_19945 [Pseudomonas sp. FW306-02-H06C]PMZ13957.1 hypothetical protein C1Y08_20510 [Pseudomonas sp. FW306-02-F02-AA]PMZ21534.1 hypothetical protein C1Y09_13945 [Pseudomonas sp. FW306-02-F08-AA]
MAVKHALWATLLIISCQTTLAAADEEYGSFGAQVSDGSELKHYNALLDQLGHLANFQNLAAVRAGSPVDNHAFLSQLSDIYVQIVKENGASYIPEYKTDTLALKNIDSFRTYALESSLKSAFEPSNETCGAAVVFLYPTLVASTLQDLKPEYIEPKSAPARIAALHQAAQQDLRNDRNVLELMCNATQFQPALTGVDSFLRLLRSDSGSFLMAIAAKEKFPIPQPVLAPKPKEPYPGYSLLTQDDRDRCALYSRWYFHAASMRDRGESPDLTYRKLIELSKLPNYSNPPDLEMVTKMVFMAYPGEAPAMITEKTRNSCMQTLAKHRVENKPFDWNAG